MKRVNKFFLFIIFIMLFSGNLYASELPEKELALDDILNITLENNPQLKAAREKLSGMEAFAEGSGRWPNPFLSIGPSLGSIEDEENILLSQAFPINGSSHFKGEKASFETLYIKALMEETLLDVLLGAKEKFYDYCVAEEKYYLQKENTEIFREILEKAKLRYDLGDISEAEVLRLELELSHFEQALIQAENQVKLARSSLFALMGIKDGGETIEISNTQEFKNIELNPDTLLEEAFILRPVIKGQEALIRAGEYEVKLAKSERYPELIISYRRDTIQEGRSPEGVEMRFEFPLWDYGTIGAEVGLAEAGIKEEEAVLEAISGFLR